METLIIDRFEGELAVCEREDCSIVTIKRNLLPPGVRPGNILKVEDNGVIRLDAEEELRRREMIFRMQENLLKHTDD